VDYVNRHFQATAGRRNKNIHCLHGGDIETFLMRYLQVSIFFQIKKPFVIGQPNIEVEKSEISFKKKTGIGKGCFYYLPTY
jgi:hypothetical protein